MHLATRPIISHYRVHTRHNLIRLSPKFYTRHRYHLTKGNLIHFLYCLCSQLSSRGDKFTAFARIEHGSTVVGEGEKVEYTNGDSLEINLQANVACSSTDLQSLMNVTKYPLIGN